MQLYLTGGGELFVPEGRDKQLFFLAWLRLSDSLEKKNVVSHSRLLLQTFYTVFLPFEWVKQLLCPETHQQLYY